MKLNTAIILCGGKGTRLGILSKKKAKTLVKIQNKEILWYLIKYLKLNGFNHFILPLGYKGDQIKKFIKKNKNFHSSFDLINTGKNTNIGKRIYKILNKIKSDNLIILNGDAIFDFNVKKIFEFHEKKKLDATFLSAESKYQFGTVCTKNNKLVDFKRNIIFDSVNIRNDNLVRAYNYAGLIIINKNILLKYSKTFYKSENFEKNFYPILIKKHRTEMKKIFGLFHSIDNIKDIIEGNSNSNNTYKKIFKLKIKFKKK